MSPTQASSCACGAAFATRDSLDHHAAKCDHAKVEKWEQTLTTMTSPGAECFPCGRLLSLDDILFRGQMLIFRPYYDSFICSKCREAFCPYEGGPQMYPDDVERYLFLRRTTVPHPWLKERREELFKELQEYLHQDRKSVV